MLQSSFFVFAAAGLSRFVSFGGSSGTQTLSGLVLLGASGEGLLCFFKNLLCVPGGHASSVLVSTTGAFSVLVSTGAVVVGKLVGPFVGAAEGDADGAKEGVSVGPAEGDPVGPAEGDVDGTAVG